MRGKKRSVALASTGHGPIGPRKPELVEAEGAALDDKAKALVAVNAKSGHEQAPVGRTKRRQISASSGAACVGFHRSTAHGRLYHRRAMRIRDFLNNINELHGFAGMAPGL